MSVQVNDLVPGAGYRFKVVTKRSSGDVKFGPTETLTAATVPSTPGSPAVKWTNAGIADISWIAPDNGGDAIRGYRLWAIGTAAAYVANTSSAAIRMQLALLPSRAYTVAVAA
jgi:hypothetical protein